FSRDSRPRDERLLRDNLYVTPATFLDEKGFRTQIPKIHTMTSALGYRLGKHDQLSSDILYSTRREDETYRLTYRDLNALQQLTGLRDRYSTTINREDSFESTLEYKHAFTKEDHELSTELRFARSSEGGPSDYTSRVLALDGAPSGATTRESIAPMERPNERSVKIDYVRPLTDHLRISAGYRGSLQKFHTTLDTRTFDAANGAFVLDPTRTTEFTFDQTVNAGYGIVTGSAGKLNFQGGLRVERAATSFRKTLSVIGFDHKYGSAFPSGLLAYHIDEATQIKLSYASRIRRPDDTDQLDPTPHYQDPLNLSRGNPQLHPEYIRSLELGFQRTGSRSTLQVTPFYRHTLDAIRRIRSIDTLGITTTTFANVATTDNYGTDATLALHGGRLSGFIGSSVYRQVSNASNISSALSARTFGWTARTNLAFRVSTTLDVQSLIGYRGRVTIEQGTLGAQTRVSLAARQKLLKDRVSLTMRVVDPFGTEHEQSTTNDPNFTQSLRRVRHVRGVLLNVTWNFGKLVKPKPLDDGERLGER
ncbi:MAG: outer membrane beta-barrel family protein, partial [Gemmatimonadaceae bacterium]